MTALAPDPATLGLESPTLGPWFSTDVTLAAPGDDLGVDVTVPAGTNWLPPAAGLLSLAVATDPLPPILAALRGPDGFPPFGDGRLIAVFRLLPEVETRLDALLPDIPASDGTTPPATTSTRTGVRTFALELPENPPPFSDLIDRIKPTPTGATDNEKAQNVGLTESGGNLGNDQPMFDLKRPGVFLGTAADTLVEIVNADATCRLYAFDARGHAVDPGAVAAWWTRITTTFNNLFATGVANRTATVDPQLTIALVGPDDGPADDAVLSRLTVTNITGTGVVRVRGSANAAASLALGGGAADDAPRPLAAVLPAGTYGATINLWTSGPVGGVARDFVRVALVDVEVQLIGQRRVAATGANAAETRRAADQRRASTRTLVDRATTAPGQTVLLATADGAMAGLIGVLGAGNATMVAHVLHRAAGALTPPPLPGVAPPDSLQNPVTMTALTGGGAASGGIVVGQKAIVETNVGAALAGAWVRVWPQYFDPETGRHERGFGGGGRIDANGLVRVVVRLADGAVAPQNRMGLDIAIVTGTAVGRYPEVRLERPLPIGGTMPAFPTVTSQIFACETGQTFTGGVPNGALASGVTLVAMSMPPALIDPASIPVAAWNASTVASSFGAGDTVQLTEPAWKGWRGGDNAATLGAGASQIVRTGLTRPTRIGSPLPTQSRDEVAASVLTATIVDGIVAAIRPLGAHHELLPHQNGHPGAPADDERHGTGARLRGPAVLSLAEILRERVAGSTVELADDASTAFAAPAIPAGPTSWAAVLRTVGFGVEAEPGLIDALNATGVNAYPTSEAFADVRAWLAGQGITIPAAVGDAATSIVRALDRRLLGARSGYREGASALAAAFGRAQDFVYVETPAIDNIPIGVGGDALAVWQALVTRAAENRALRVLVCVPVHLAPGVPKKLERVRNKGLIAALKSLRSAAGDRVAVFTPVTGPGRSLHLDATTVVVDDAFALTGGTHLSLRGLSFDSSLAVSVFDERLTNGRPAEVVAFRRSLIAGRLGLALSLLPEDPEQLVRAVRQLSARSGGLRFAPEAIEVPDPIPSDADVRAWNPDGSTTSGFDPVEWLGALTAAVQAELAAEIPGSP